MAAEEINQDTRTVGQIIDDMNLFDDDLMSMVFDKNIPATELLLKVILKRDDIKVISVAGQREFQNPVVGGRNIRLDILAKDSTGKHYDIEVQRKPEGANVKINNAPWKGNRVNKTLTYMAETQITQKDIEKVICELQLSNYSYTADDKNKNFRDEQVWIFGITKAMIDKDEDLYVKLKIRVIEEEMLLIMSFHPEEPDYSDQKLEFPYKE